jgi:hypothetical protein
MTFGFALKFSHSPLKRNGDLRKAPWVKLAKGFAKHGFMEWPAARSATHGECSNRERQPQPTICVRRLFAPEPAA